MEKDINQMKTEEIVQYIKKERSAVIYFIADKLNLENVLGIPISNEKWEEVINYFENDKRQHDLIVDSVDIVFGKKKIKQ